MKRDRRDSARVITAGVLVAYFSLLVGLGGLSAWRRLGVPTMSFSFADLRSITSGWECHRRGIDVLALNPCDPWERPANYPRAWMLPSILGLGEESTASLGFLLAGVFLLAALAIVPRHVPSTDGLVYGAALCSPSVMLAVERGNVDTILFAMIVLAVVALRRGVRGPYVSAGLILLTAILKLFPIFAVGLLARQRRREALLSCGVVLGVFALYAAVTLGDIRTIARVVPQVDSYSYGATVVGNWVLRALHSLPGQIWGSVNWSGQALGHALVVTVLATAIIFRRRIGGWFPPAEPSADSTRDLDFFWAGGPVYVCTFMLFRSFDYRLVFLIMCIPLLLRWTRQGAGFALGTLGFVLGTLWLPEASRVVAPAQLLVFAGLVAALVATPPTWRSRNESPGRQPYQSA